MSADLEFFPVYEYPRLVCTNDGARRLLPDNKAVSIVSFSTLLHHNREANMEPRQDNWVDEVTCQIEREERAARAELGAVTVGERLQAMAAE